MNREESIIIDPQELIINKNAWTQDFYHRVGLNMESIAGYGSSLMCVKPLIQELPNIFKEFNIKSITDIPCGDYFWMNLVEKNGIDYIGYDLVDDQIIYNKNKYSDVNFQQLNMIVDNLPTADLIFSRDCFIHLSFKHINSFLQKCYESKSTYIMTSTYPTVMQNEDLNGVIGWRCLNLELEPFNFPSPIKIINEGYYKDPKCMGIWKISDII
jgi:hypothetical protein